MATTPDQDAGSQADLYAVEVGDRTADPNIEVRSSPGQDEDMDGGAGEYDAERSESIGLDELEAAAPDENADDATIYRRSTLEGQRRSEQRSASRREHASRALRSTRLLASIYVHAYLIFLSILGVLARLGLVALTTCPGAPLINPVVWANVAGSLLMGFLREDRMLSRRHWRTELSKEWSQEQSSDLDGSSSPTDS